MMDFDQAVGKALDFAEKDGKTLVIVTADHETGGFTLAGSTIPGGKNDNNYAKITPRFSTNGHSTTLIPVCAFGPGSHNFSGFYENHDIFHKILKAMDWDPYDGSE